MSPNFVLLIEPVQLYHPCIHRNVRVPQMQLCIPETASQFKEDVALNASSVKKCVILSLLLLSGCASTDSLAWLQWPAMIVTVTASWFVTSRYKKNRIAGFILFLISNILWTVWGLHTHANALVLLQGCLVGLNVLGLKRAE